MGEEEAGFGEVFVNLALFNLEYIKNLQGKLDLDSHTSSVLSTTAYDDENKRFHKAFDGRATSNPQEIEKANPK